MNARSLYFGLAALVLSAGPVSAQVVYNNASTVGESYARGMSDVISAAGDYNLRTSQAAINMTEANRQDIINREAATRAYFEMRAINRDYRAKERGPRPSMEDLVRFAQAGKPRQLSPSEMDFSTGRLNWPKLLTIPAFGDYRHDLEMLFVKRADHGGLGYDDQIRVRNATTMLLNDLKANIQAYPPADYMAARRFVESLAYEAQLPTG